MKGIVVIGAPSLTGGKSRREVQKEVVDRFPAARLVTNLTGRVLMTPACILEIGAKDQPVVFNAQRAFKGFFSDISALAELNQWEEAVIIKTPELLEDDPEKDEPKDDNKEKIDVVDSKAGNTNEESQESQESQGEISELVEGFKSDPKSLDKDELFKVADSLGIQTRSNNTEEWLIENISSDLDKKGGE